MPSLIGQMSLAIGGGVVVGALLWIACTIVYNLIKNFLKGKV